MDNKFNILIRTTYRPRFFKKCIESIIKQNYKNIRIICCYDDFKCLDYLQKYEKLIDYYYIYSNNKSKYKYNLYVNDLISRVNEGWIIFLDDDDKFSSNNVLSLLNENIKSNDDIIFWKFLRPDKEIYPKNINDIKSGQIANCTYCFHSNFKNSAKWTSSQIGDFHFINKLVKSHNFNRKFIEICLTKTIWNDEDKVGNDGIKEKNLDFNEYFYENCLVYLDDEIDIDYYLKKYKDLKELKDFYENPLEHWLKYGKKECRSCSVSYNKILKEKYKIFEYNYKKLNKKF